MTLNTEGEGYMIVAYCPPSFVLINRRQTLGSRMLLHVLWRPTSVVCSFWSFVPWSIMMLFLQSTVPLFCLHQEIRILIRECDTYSAAPLILHNHVINCLAVGLYAVTWWSFRIPRVISTSTNELGIAGDYLFNNWTQSDAYTSCLKALTREQLLMSCCRLREWMVTTRVANPTAQALARLNSSRLTYSVASISKRPGSGLWTWSIAPNWLHFVWLRFDPAQTGRCQWQRAGKGLFKPTTSWMPLLD
jgi:hypothetical protein